MMIKFIKKIRTKLKSYTEPQKTNVELFYTNVNGRDTIDRVRDLSYFIARNSMSKTLSEDMIDQIADILYTFFCYSVAVSSKDRGQPDDLKRAAFFTSLAKIVNNPDVVDSYIREEWKE